MKYTGLNLASLVSLVAKMLLKTLEINDDYEHINGGSIMSINDFKVKIGNF